MIPPVILQLGGDPARVAATVAAKREFPAADVIVSSEGETRTMVQLLEGTFGIPRWRWIGWHWWARSWDTVSDFTTSRAAVLAAFKGAMTADRQLIIVTGQSHMRRALAIARVVYAGEEVILTPRPLHHERADSTAPWWRLALDVTRAAIWRLTGCRWLPSNPWRKARCLKTARRALTEIFPERTS